MVSSELALSALSTGQRAAYNTARRRCQGDADLAHPRLGDGVTRAQMDGAASRQEFPRAMDLGVGARHLLSKWLWEFRRTCWSLFAVPSVGASCCSQAEAICLNVVHVDCDTRLSMRFLSCFWKRPNPSF